MPHSPKLMVPAGIWRLLLVSLRVRTEGRHESGAFLLGTLNETRRKVERVVYYDELDANAYRTGVVILYAESFGPLWDICRSSGLSVVADIHVHPKKAWQSLADRDNPMIAVAGHLAIIVPNFAAPPIVPETLGFYEYQGAHRWRDFSGRHIADHLEISEGSEA